MRLAHGMWLFEMHSPGAFTFITPVLLMFPCQLLTTSFVKQIVFPYLSLETLQVPVHRHSIPDRQIKNCSKEIHDRLVGFCLLYQS